MPSSRPSSLSKLSFSSVAAGEIQVWLAEWFATSRVKADLDDFLGTWYESVAPRNALLGGSLSIYSPILFVRMINFDREC